MKLFLAAIIVAAGLPSGCVKPAPDARATAAPERIEGAWQVEDIDSGGGSSTMRWSASISAMEHGFRGAAAATAMAAPAPMRRAYCRSAR